MVLLNLSCGTPKSERSPTVSNEEYTNESFSQAITGHLALSVPSCVDAQISLSDLEWLVAEEVSCGIRTFSEQLQCEVVELNVQIDHVHRLVMILPKISVSDYVGTVKGRTAIRVFNRFQHLKRKPYWGNHF